LGVAGEMKPHYTTSHWRVCPSDLFFSLFNRTPPEETFFFFVYFRLDLSLAIPEKTKQIIVAKFFFSAVEFFLSSCTNSD
jgi:hypothetical protein